MKINLKRIRSCIKPNLGAVQNTVSPFKFFQAAKQEKDINNRDPSY